jgi:hypothetical protein
MMAANRDVLLIHGMWGGPWCGDGYRSVFEAGGWRCHAPALPYHDADAHSMPDPRLGCAGLLDYADAPSHRTGDAAIERFWRAWGERFVDGGLGAVIEVSP